MHLRDSTIGLNKTIYVHILVAKAFVPNEHRYRTINHINEDKCDNRASNLEWCTQQYNNTYGSRSRKMGETIGSPIIAVTDTKRLWFRSQSSASRYLKCPQANIQQCLTKRRRIVHGYSFENFEE